MPDPLSLINRRHARYLDSMIEAFEEQLREIMNKAQAKLTGFLQTKLTITDGVVDATPKNMAILRFMDDRFMTFLNDSGYDKLLAAFTSEFAGQQVFLQDTLKYLGFDDPGFSASDIKALSSMRLNTTASLQMVAETAARTATQQVLFSMGGLKFAALIETIGEKLGASVARARSIADTAQASFYRTMTDRTFQTIEKDLPAQEQRYMYAGPDDRLTRPFCVRLIESDKTYTREEIGEMSNGQIPNVMLSGGGWNCRHTFLLSRPAPMAA